jgi:hypothetical protein
MTKALLAIVTTAMLAGCASPDAGTPPPQQEQPMPDGRELTEHPLDVLDLPQP